MGLIENLSFRLNACMVSLPPCCTCLRGIEVCVRAHTRGMGVGVVGVSVRVSQRVRVPVPVRVRVRVR